MSPTPLKIAVFGGTGFIGRCVVKRLARRGVQVIVPTRDMDRVLPLKVNGDTGQIVGAVGRIDDDNFLRAVCRKADAVINLIGIMHESGTSSFSAIHAEFAGRLAKTAKTEGVKALVHISALGADKSSPSKYARTKAVGEEAVLQAFPDATILRPSIVVGEGDDFFNRFGRMMRFTPALPLIGGGKTKFQPVVVGDVADAIVAALDEPDSAGQIYELGGPAVLTFKQCMQMLLKVTEQKRLLFPMPFWLIGLKALYLQFFPAPFKVTPDQVQLLKRDNVVHAGAKNFADLGITPTSIELILPSYLDKFRVGGRYL